jgi:hypothetical protein
MARLDRAIQPSGARSTSGWQIGAPVLVWHDCEHQLADVGWTKFLQSGKLALAPGERRGARLAIICGNQTNPEDHLESMAGVLRGPISGAAAVTRRVQLWSG